MRLDMQMNQPRFQFLKLLINEVFVVFKKSNPVKTGLLEQNLHDFVDYNLYTAWLHLELLEKFP